MAPRKRHPKTRPFSGYPIYWRPARQGRKGYFYTKVEGKHVWLCGDVPVPEVWSAYRARDGEPDASGSLGDIATRYFGSADFRSLKPRTQADYRQTWKGIGEQLNSKNRPLRTTPARAWKAEHIQSLIDLWDGKPTTANKRAGFLLMLLGWGRRRDSGLQRIERSDVRMIRVRKARRYPSLEELTFAQKHARPMVAAALELAFLTGMRVSDLVDLKWSDIRDGHIHLTPQKTEDSSGRRLKIEVTPGLQKALDMARDACDVQVRGYVICNAKGHGYSRDGFNSIWQRDRAKAIAAGMDSFTWHSIRKLTESVAKSGGRLLGIDERTARKFYDLSEDKVKPAER